MVDESVTVKGSPVRSLQKFIEDELTPEQYHALVDIRSAARERSDDLVPRHRHHHGDSGSHEPTGR